MDIFRNGLKKSVSNIPDEPPPVLGEGYWFTKLYNEWKECDTLSENSTFKAIPKFNKVPPYAEELGELETLPAKLDLEVRSTFLQNVNESLLSTEDLKALKSLLDEYSTKENNSEKMICYKDLKEVLSKASENCKLYFNAILFSQFLKKGRIDKVSIVSLFTYAMRKSWHKKTRIGLCVYDGIGKGFLRECELETFILDIIPECPQLESLKESFYPFYVCTVVRKFMFFLDPMRTGKIRLKDVMASNFLDDLLVLRNEVLPDDSLEGNWFSASSALRIYGQYLNLDKDSNGMLSKSELAAIGTGTLTETFLERFFQEYLTYGGEMDYKAYLDFVLAMEYKQEPQALRYFFRIFDIDGKGYLDGFALNYFFRSIQKEMKKRNQEPVGFEDIKDELFDMVRPADPTRITFLDLINCEQAVYFVNILSDLNEFWNYENREFNY